MLNNFFYSSPVGCILVIDNTTIVLDPSKNFASIMRYMNTLPTAVIFTNSRKCDCSGLFNIYNTNRDIRLFSSKKTSEMIYNELVLFAENEESENYKSAIESIMQFSFGENIVLGRNTENEIKISFFSGSEVPGSSAVYFKWNSGSLLYVSGGLPKDKKIPKADTVIIRNNGTPFEAIRNKNVALNLDSFSTAYYLFNFLNKLKPGTTIGLDKSIMPLACKYIKMGYPVFAKNILPLDALASEPDILVTSNKNNSKGRLKINAEELIRNIPISEIYSCKRIHSARRVYIVCPFNHLSKRANIQFCKDGIIKL